MLSTIITAIIIMYVINIIIVHVHIHHHIVINGLIIIIISV